MGMNPEAHLAYGYDLGTDEDPQFAEKGEYDQPDLPWFNDEEEDEYGDTRVFVEQMFNHLYSTIEHPPPADSDWRRQNVVEEHFGVRIAYSGHADSSGQVLIADGSHQSVEWSDVMELDLGDLADETRLPDWSKRLAVVIEALGVTPTQRVAKWLVFPSYG